MDVTLSQLFREYELFHRAKARTHDKARKAFGHLVTFAGDVPARELSPGRVNKWSVWLATLRHASPDTTRKHYVGLNRRQCEQAVRTVINAYVL